MHSCDYHSLVYSPPSAPLFSGHRWCRVSFAEVRAHSSGGGLLGDYVEAGAELRLEKSLATVDLCMISLPSMLRLGDRGAGGQARTPCACALSPPLALGCWGGARAFTLICTLSLPDCHPLLQPAHQGHLLSQRGLRQPPSQWACQLRGRSAGLQ